MDRHGARIFRSTHTRDTGSFPLVRYQPCVYEEGLYLQRVHITLLQLLALSGSCYFYQQFADSLIPAMTMMPVLTAMLAPVILIVTVLGVSRGRLQT